MLLALLPGALPAQNLEAVLSRMDAASASFQSLTARLRILKYTAIVRDESVEEGAIWVQRLKRGRSRLLIEFSSPDRYYVALSDKKAEIYRPKIGQVEEWDISRYRDLAEQIWPFGASGRDLSGRYAISWKGPEAVAGQAAVKLELTPKSEKLAQNVPRIETWISTSHWQPVQQKFYDPTPGDFRLSTYTQVQLNVPLADSRLKLQLQPGAKRVVQK